MTDRRLLATVSVLYVASGLPFGVIQELVPVWLKVKGVSLVAIGLATLVGLPWTLKPLWAPIVDRNGTAGGWAAAGLVGIGIGLVVAPWIEPGPALWALLVGVAVLSATQDIAIDGWTATAVPDALQGRANGVRVAAYRGAMLAAGGGAVALGGRLGWPAVIGGLGLTAMGLAAWARTLPAAGARASTDIRTWVRELAGWIASPGCEFVLPFVLVFKLGDAAMAPMIKPFWMDAGLTVEEVGIVSIGIGTGLTIAGALAGGEWASRRGLWEALVGCGALQAVSNLGYAVAALSPSRAAVWAASAVESFCGGLGTAAFLAFLMRLCERSQAATRFALLTALMGLTRTLAGAISGYGAERAGYAGWFAITFALALPGLALLPLVRDRARGSAA